MQKKAKMHFQFSNSYQKGKNEKKRKHIYLDFVFIPSAFFCIFNLKIYEKRQKDKKKFFSKSKNIHKKRDQLLETYCICKKKSKIIFNKKTCKKRQKCKKRMKKRQMECTLLIRGSYQYCEGVSAVLCSTRTDRIGGTIGYATHSHAI